MAKDAKGLVLMNTEDGIFTNELGSYEIEEGMQFVYKTFVADGLVKLFVTTDRDVSDDEFNEIFDEYETEELTEEGFEIEEIEDEYNPVWCITLKFSEDFDVMTDDLNYILAYHKGEIERIYEKIKS